MPIPAPCRLGSKTGQQTPLWTSSVLVFIGWIFLTGPISQARPLTNSAPADIFSTGYVGRLTIEVPDEAVRKLRQSPRHYVTGTVKEGGFVYTNVGVHLKGRVGSFRSIDQNPALTLNFDKFAAGQTFHGYKKIHLNNSVQDRTYLHEKISRDMFLEAGVPVPRAAHAVVQLNGTRPRLCVLVEGANKQFLKRHFKNSNGNLYDGGFCRDINNRLRLNSGENPANQSDLRALVRAVAEPDPDKCAAALEKTLDVDRFLSFLAMEIMIAHWDGYGLNVNNYRVYHDPASDKLVFIPHGTDQVFHNTGMPAKPEMKGLVAQAVLEIPALRARYFERMHYLLTNVFVVERLTKEVRDVAARIRPFIRDNLENGVRYEEVVAGFCRQIARRRQFLERELAGRASSLAAVPVAFDPRGHAALPEWNPITHIGTPQLRRSADQHLCIVAEGPSVASWRTQIKLEPGEYRFSGEVKVTDLNVAAADPKAGVALRISRQDPGRRIKANTDWTTLSCDFEVENNPTVELVCEFRGRGGEVCFDRKSLKITRR